MTISTYYIIKRKEYHAAIALGIIITQAQRVVVMMMRRRRRAEKRRLFNRLCEGVLLKQRFDDAILLLPTISLALFIVIAIAFL